MGNSNSTVKKKRKNIPLISRNRGFLSLLTGISPCSRKKVIKTCNRGEINTICEIVHNFLKKNLTSDQKIIKRLKKYKSALRALANKRVRLHKKRSILRSKRGGSILSLLLPLLGGIFMKNV